MKHCVVLSGRIKTCQASSVRVPSKSKKMTSTSPSIAERSPRSGTEDTALVAAASKSCGVVGLLPSPGYWKPAQYPPIPKHPETSKAGLDLQMSNGTQHTCLQGAAVGDPFPTFLHNAQVSGKGCWCENRKRCNSCRSNGTYVRHDCLQVHMFD